MPWRRKGWGGTLTTPRLLLANSGTPNACGSFLGTSPCLEYIMKSQYASSSLDCSTVLVWYLWMVDLNLSTPCLHWIWGKLQCTTMGSHDRWEFPPLFFFQRSIIFPSARSPNGGQFAYCEACARRLWICLHHNDHMVCVVAVVEYKIHLFPTKHTYKASYGFSILWSYIGIVIQFA